MRISTAPYCPLFDIKTRKPIHGYYSLAAFNRLYRLGQQVETSTDTEELYVVAASGEKGNAIMISNLSGSEQELIFNGIDLADARFYILDQGRLLSWAPNANSIPNHAVMLIEF